MSEATEDRRMLFIPELNLITRVYRDENGLYYVHLPEGGKRKSYLGEEEAEK